MSEHNLSKFRGEEYLNNFLKDNRYTYIVTFIKIIMFFFLPNNWSEDEFMEYDYG